MKMRHFAMGLGALAAGFIAAAVSLGWGRSDAQEGHAAPDLDAGAAPTDRAPVAFRPDMDAPMTAAEREALRPATGPAPTLVGTGTSLPG